MSSVFCPKPGAWLLLSVALFTRMLAAPEAAAEKALTLENDRVKLTWRQQADGWHLAEAQARGEKGWITLRQPSGLHTILYLNRNPAPALVEVDREGTAYPFYPDKAEKRADGTLVLRQSLSIGEVTSEWSLDPKYPADVRVSLSIIASRRGSFSLATPTLLVWERDEIAWGMVPGNWYGTSVEDNLELSTIYSQGIPGRAFLATERNTMTLCPLLSGKDGVTLAVIPEPGTSADPWALDKDTHDQARLGISTMDRYSRFTPVVYAPKLGAPGSKTEKGATVALNFRYTLAAKPWFDVFEHAATEVYQFQNILGLQSSRESLADRVGMLQTMLKDDKKSAWKTTTVNGVQIGSNGQKTSDIGAMWMIARTSEDPALLARLPLLRNYKLAQQQTSPGFFQYAATGEYPEEHGFAAERGNWIEPLFTTYYTLQDMGNIALFDKGDTEIRERIRLAADKLLSWQLADGSWDVAYDRVSHRSAYPFLKDLRPTWYGLVVAARILKDERYLTAARRGADWYLANAVAPGRYLGACGDALNIWDFTTAFGSQALLDLYALTKEPKYQAAAIEVARVYATTVFTHPVATNAEKKVGGLVRKDWEINQVGLSVEHIAGTGKSGPITLSSQAGLFIRMYELTGQAVFRDMARAAARGRHHFSNPETGLAVYYWSSIENVAKGSTMFPWHAEWQIGWITDYLMAEAHLRSKGRVSFPSGFATPKVGPHVTYGFDPGTVFGHPASLWLPGKAVSCDNPNAEYLCAVDQAAGKLYVIVMNQFPQGQTVSVKLDPSGSVRGRPLRWTGGQSLDGTVAKFDSAGSVQVTMEPWGMSVVKLDLVAP